VAQKKLLDGSGYRKLKEVITAQAGIRSPGSLRTIAERDGRPRDHDSAPIRERDRCEYIGQASAMIGRTRYERGFDRSGGRRDSRSQNRQKVDAGSVLCRLYYTSEEHVEEAAQFVEDAFRISAAAPEEAS